MTCINGETSSQISVFDRGFQYGDGVFETILVKKGSPILLDQHFSRLLLGCHKLFIYPPDKTYLTQKITRLAEEIGERGVIKIVYTRGSGGRGYSPEDTNQPGCVLMKFPFPDDVISKRTHGVSVDFCQTTLPVDSTLSQIKHLNRLHQVIASHELLSSDVDEGIMCSADGYVIEGIRTNLFLVKEGKLITPSVDMCGVKGVMRQAIIDRLSTQSVPAQICKVSKQDLLGCDYAFLCNSIIGIWPVSNLAGRSLPFGVLYDKLFDLVNDLLISD